MQIHFNNNSPIYIQIMNEVKQNIISGKYSLGEKLPPVREWASEYSVNPNTMQRALSELEREKLLYTERTSGRFITDDREMVMQLRKEIAQKELEQFLLNMKKIGFQNEEIIDLIKNMLKEEMTYE